MQTIEQFLSNYNIPKRGKKPVTTVEQIEKIANFKLPPDYLVFYNVVP
jgi:hypothetical protein